MVLCNKCGCTMQDTDQVCGVCGASLIGNSTPVTEPASPMMNNNMGVDSVVQPAMMNQNMGMNQPDMQTMNMGVNQGAFQPTELSQIMGGPMLNTEQPMAQPPEFGLNQGVAQPVDMNQMTPTPVTMTTTPTQATTPEPEQKPAKNKKPFIIVVVLLALAIACVGISVVTRMGSKDTGPETNPVKESNPNRIIYADHEFDFPKNYNVSMDYNNSTIVLLDLEKKIQIHVWVCLESIDNIKQAYSIFSVPFTFQGLEVSKVESKTFSKTNWFIMNTSIEKNNRNVATRYFYANLDDYASLEGYMFDYEGTNATQSMEELSKAIEKNKYVGTENMEDYSKIIKEIESKVNKKIELDDSLLQEES